MIAVMVSGGKDSTATLLLAIERHGKENTIGIFTDTGWEAKETYEYLDYLEEKTGVKIHRLKNKNFDGIPDIIRKKKRFPSPVYRFCTAHLKLVPLAEFLANTELPIKEIWLGIRLSESRFREKKYSRYDENEAYDYYEWLSSSSSGEIKKETKLKIKEKGIKLRMPILTWEEKDVFEYLKKNGIKPNTLYEKGFKRVGCFPCLLSGLYEWKLCWKTEQGRKNIELLFEIEKELNEKGIMTRIKDAYDRHRMKRILEQDEAQLNLFCEQSCGFCSI